MNKPIKDKRWTHIHEVSGEDMIVVDEYEDQTYRLWIPGDYQQQEIDKDFATVESIREYLGLRKHSEMDKFILERDELQNSIRQAKIELEQVEKQIEGVKDIKELLPQITPSGEAVLEGLLLIIEKSDSGLHEIASHVRSVGLDDKGVQTSGPHQMIPARDGENETGTDSEDE